MSHSVMNPTPQSSRPEATPGLQRTACDRCRHHKLRCNREPGVDECRRCIRANEKCFTSPARKAGRPQRLFRSPSPAAASQSTAMLQTPPDSTNDPSPAEDNQLPLTADALTTLGNALASNAATSTQQVQDRPIEALNANVDHRIDQITRRSQCMKALGQLQDEVINDVDLIKGCRIAPRCLSVAASHAEYGLGAPNPDFMIGRLLNHSKTLLEILDCFDLRREAAPYGTERPDGLLFCDMPALFSIMSCYICLIRTYRTIFACLLESIPYFRTEHNNLPDPLLQILPSLDFGGFSLSHRVDLQLQILVQVTEDMLYKLENKFGIGRATTTGLWSPTEGPTKATGLMWMMLEQEIAEVPPLDEPRGDCGSLKEILKSIKRELRMEAEATPNAGPTSAG